MRQMEARCASVMCTVQSGLRDSMAKGEVWHNNRYLLVEVNNRCAMHAVKVRANERVNNNKILHGDLGAWTLIHSIGGSRAPPDRPNRPNITTYYGLRLRRRCTRTLTPLPPKQGHN